MEEIAIKHPINGCKISYWATYTHAGTHLVPLKHSRKLHAELAWGEGEGCVPC